jgi:DNA-binding SARP family transcriptional activator
VGALRLQLLGRPQAWRDEQPLVFKTRKTFALLAYLAAEGGLHPRARLAPLFWPDRDPAEARNNLRTTLVFLRQALGSDADALLLATRLSIGVSPGAPLTLDIQALARAERLANATEAPAGLAEELAQAVALYTGPFLDDANLPGAREFEDWVQEQRAHWLWVAGMVLDRLATVYEDAGNMTAAVGALERWVTLEPGEEAAWWRLITAHLALGDDAAARRAWGAGQAALARLGMEPSAQTMALAARISALSPTHPPAVSGALPPNLVSVALHEAPLVGRTREMTWLRRAFAQTCTGQTRTVVVEGPAGSGKTRLAGELLAWAQAQGADAVVGRTFETADNLPYAPIVEALRPRLERENAPDDLLSDVWLAELARILPELHERYPDLPSPARAEPAGHGLLFEAIARLGLALAERAPVVLVLDDVQWTDAATRDLMSYAVRRWARVGARVLVLLTLTIEQSGGDRAIAHWLSRLERDAPTLRFGLQALTTTEVIRYVAALARTDEGDPTTAPAEEAVRFGCWLAHATGGQPFALVHTLRSLLDSGVVAWRLTPDGGWALDLAGTQPDPAGLAETCHDPTAVALSADCAMVAAGTSRGELRLWRLTDGAPLRCMRAHRGAIHSVAFSADNRLLASGGEDAMVKLWEAESGRLVATLRGEGGAIQSLALSADGRLLAGASRDGLVTLWETRSGQLVTTLRGGGWCAFPPA